MPQELATRIRTDIDFGKDGKQVSYLHVPSSTNISAYGAILVPIAVIRNGGGSTILMTGGVHGDEYEGPIALSNLARRLQSAQVRGRAIIVPALNLPAIRAGTRLSPVDGLNLNRVFPGERDGSVTSMIAHYVSSVLIPMADIVVDLHSGGSTLEYIPTVMMHARDDPEWTRRTMAALEIFGAPIALVSREIDSAIYLDTIAESLGKITLSAELGGAGTVSRSALEIGETGIANLLAHFGIVAGPIADPASRGRPATRLLETPDYECYSAATEDGVHEPLVDLGERIEAGQPIGRIHFLHQTMREPAPIRAGRTGTLICRRPPAQVRVGDCLAVVALAYGGA